MCVILFAELSDTAGLQDALIQSLNTKHAVELSFLTNVINEVTLMPKTEELSEVCARARLCACSNCNLSM